MTDELEQDYVEQSERGAEYSLWLRVTLLSVWELKHRQCNEAAKAFLFDEGNPFFEAVCDGLGCEPEAIRERLRKTVTPGRGGGVFDSSHHEAIHEPTEDKNASQVI